MDLSMPAELLLLAIDPANGGVLAKSRRRLRRALAHAAFADGGASVSLLRGRGARGPSRRELVQSGLVERRAARRRLHLVDRPYAARLFNHVRNCTSECPRYQRHSVLFILLAWSGVLRRRLPRGERRLALRRLRAIVPSAHGEGAYPLVGIGALGSSRPARMSTS